MNFGFENEQQFIIWAAGFFDGEGSIYPFFITKEVTPFICG